MKKNKTLRFLGALMAAAAVSKGCVSADLDSKPDKEIDIRPFFVNRCEQTDEIAQDISRFCLQSPSAQKLLQDVKKCSPCFLLEDVAPDSDGNVDGGKCDGKNLILNINPQVRSVKSLFDTFLHEAEHLVHLAAGKKMGINALSFASLDDLFCYNSILEALAERQVAVCFAEKECFPMSLQDQKEIEAIGDKAFLDSLLCVSRETSVQDAYVMQTLLFANEDTKTLPNQRFFNENPNWDEIVCILSRGQVKKMPLMPKPTLQFMGLCLLREIQKHPTATSVDAFDLSCVLQNRSALKKDELAVKTFVSDMLFEVIEKAEKNGYRFSPEEQQSLCYWLGFPTVEQVALIQSNQATFNDLRQANLNALKTQELFDATIELVENIEQKNELKECFSKDHYAKILRFSKQILYPNTSGFPKYKEKSR